MISARAGIAALGMSARQSWQTVSDAQNCGNLLAGVGLFAIAEELVEPADPVTQVRVRMLNTGALCHLDMQTPGGTVRTEGDTAIDGVPGFCGPGLRRLPSCLTHRSRSKA